jgi:hypothetical protein
MGKYIKKKKKRSGYTYTKNGKKIKVPAHKQRYRMRKRQPISRKKAREIMEKRSKRAQAIDRSKTAKKIKEKPDTEWAEGPGRSDVTGLDTHWSDTWEKKGDAFEKQREARLLKKYPSINKKINEPIKKADWVFEMEIEIIELPADPQVIIPLRKAVGRKIIKETPHLESEIYEATASGYMDQTKGWIEQHEDSINSDTKKEAKELEKVYNQILKEYKRRYKSAEYRFLWNDPKMYELKT